MASILETRISAVRNARSTATYTITLADAVKAITGPENASSVVGIRQAITDGRLDDARKLKCSLQGIMFAGEFTRRRADAITQHSGLMVLDFDHVDEAEQHRDRIGNDPHAVLCFVSPSGQGLKLVVRIDPDAAGHGESFDAARAYFRDKYGLEADPSGRDVSRLCFVSHDPELVFREDAELLHRQHRQHMTIQTTHDHTSNERECVCSPPQEQEPQTEVPLPMETITKIIQQTQPDHPGQRHRKLFDLARGLRFECCLAEAPPRQLKTIVKKWFEIAKPNISTQSFTESWVDFCHAWPRAKKPLNENALNIAWNAVQSGNLPEESYLYDLEGVQKLCGLCWHLGHDQKTFYLSMHEAGKLLCEYPQTVSRWLDVLKVDCLIELLETGKRGGKASTYRWTAKGAQ